MSKITMDRERITPKIAAEYLKCNVHNRNLNERRVARLAAALERGEWEENAETIKFDENNTLIDGQHRLAAVVAAKTSIYSWVARNCSTTAQETIDEGVSRSAGDVLKLRGYDDANQLAAVARHLVVVQNGAQFGTSTNSENAPTSQQILKFVEAEPDLGAYARFGRWFADQDKSLGLPRSFVGAAAFAFASAATRDDSLEFFCQVLNPSSQTTPAALLRKRLQRGKTAISDLPRGVKAALTIKAWNAFIRGEAPKQLKFAPGGSKPDAFPVIEGAPE